VKLQHEKFNFDNHQCQHNIASSTPSILQSTSILLLSLIRRVLDDEGGEITVAEGWWKAGGLAIRFMEVEDLVDMRVSTTSGAGLRR